MGVSGMRSGEKYLPRLENYMHMHIHIPPHTCTHSSQGDRSLLSVEKDRACGEGQVGAAGLGKGERRETAGEGVQPSGCEEVSGGVLGGGSRKSFPPVP